MAVKKVNQLATLGTLQAGDVVVGERVSGTTGLLAVGPLSIADGDKGDIVVSASGSVWTVENDAISYAKIQNVSDTDKLLGRSSMGAGDVEEITCTAAGRALLDDADAAAQRTTLGLGTLATQSGTVSGTNTGDQNTFAQIAISGQNPLNADSTSDTLTVVAGTGISLTTDAATDAFTIASTVVGVTDGDKGEVVVSGGGTTWILDDNLTLHGTQGVTFPQGSSAGRPAAGVFGRERYNTSTGHKELDDGAAWNWGIKTPELTTVANAIPKWAGTNSSALATSGITIDASNNISGAGTYNGTNIASMANVSAAGYSSANQSLANNTFVKVQFNTEEFDIGGYYDTTTFRYTPLVAGRYLVTAQLQFALSATAEFTIAVRVTKNNTLHKSTGNTAQVNSNSTTGISAIFNMNGTTDFIEIYGLQGSGAARNLLADSERTFFAVTLL